MVLALFDNQPTARSLDMPRGNPKAGFRQTKKWKERGGMTKEQAEQAMQPAFLVNSTGGISIPPQAANNDSETDEEVGTRIKERFDALSEMMQMTIDGHIRAMIVSGPPGLSKSYTVEQKLAEWNPEGELYKIVKGYVRPPWLYRLLYQYKDEGQILVFDDADSVFFDEVGLNFLKAACDTTEKRVLHYLTETGLADDDGEEIPRSFEFNGSVIFLTNYDFFGLASKTQLGPHFQALMSRAHYIDCAMYTIRDFVIRIQQVVDEGMLENIGLTADESEEVMQFIRENAEQLTEISLRTALKIGALRKHATKWQSMAKITCCRQRRTPKT